MSNTNTEATETERAEAMRHIDTLTAWLNSHPLCPKQAQARSDRVRELSRWLAYLQSMDRKHSYWR